MRLFEYALAHDISVIEAAEKLVREGQLDLTCEELAQTDSEQLEYLEVQPPNERPFP